ncbi:MAG: type II secretion system protein [Phycisphaerales bacterium]
MRSTTRPQTGFSLIELVIVLIIMGVLVAIAIPRLSRGAEGTAATALQSDLSALRRAIELYRYEHNGLIPENDSKFIDQMTQFTDIDGDISPVKTATHIYGPYLATMPALPVGENKGSREVRDGGKPGDGDDGWFYDKDTGEIVANTEDDEVDGDGVPYNQY